MKHFFAFLLLSSFTFTACDGIFKTNDCNNCDDIACTEEFKMIAIDVVDTDGTPIKLNDYKITFTKTGDAVSLNQDDQLIYGKYILATDAMMADLECDGTKITFSYSLDGKSYTNETFLIGKDCCHLQWRDDKAQEIVVD